MVLTYKVQEALRHNNLDAVEANLVRSPATKRQEELNESLTLAMPHGTLDMIKLLLLLGANLKQASFHSAVAREEAAVFQLLVEAGWDIDSTEYEMSAVHHAVYKRTLLPWLLAHGANPNTISSRRLGSCAQRCTPLACAAELADSTSLQILMSHGAELDPNALFHAIGLRRQDNGTATMEALIDNGADVNYVSIRWATPLHQAVRIMDEEKLRFLLDYGADPNVKNSSGRTSALDRAKELGRMHLFDIMDAAQRQKAP